MRTLKIVGLVVVIFAVLGVAGVIWAKSIWNKISFGKPRLEGLDLQGLTLNDLLNIALAGQTKEVKATLVMDIKNDSGLSIPFRILKIKLLSAGTVIAETSDAISIKRTLPKHSSLPISDTISIIFNDAGGNLLIDKLKGGNPELEYKTLISVFGIPIPFKGGKFTW